MDKTWQLTHVGIQNDLTPLIVFCWRKIRVIICRAPGTWLTRLETGTIVGPSSIFKVLKCINDIEVDTVEARIEDLPQV